MANFPSFQLDQFLKVLVQGLNKYVAISEEFTGVAEGKLRSVGLKFDRRVARVITPGTPRARARHIQVSQSHSRRLNGAGLVQSTLNLNGSSARFGQEIDGAGIIVHPLAEHAVAYPRLLIGTVHHTGVCNLKVVEWLVQSPKLTYNIGSGYHIVIFLAEWFKRVRLLRIGTKPQKMEDESCAS